MISVTTAMAVALPAYVLLDFNYFIRLVGTVFVGRYFRRKISVTEGSTIYGIVLPSDIDFNLDYMSNSRVLREFDFGRLEHAARTGILISSLKKGMTFPVNANFIRYRLPIRPFSLYKVETLLTHWDTKHFYIEQKLITLSDGVVRAVAYPKISVPNYNVENFAREVTPNAVSPQANSTTSYINDLCDVVSRKFKKG